MFNAAAIVCSDKGAKGLRVDTSGEYIKIKPMFTGITQLIGLLQAIDQGYCDED